MKEYNDFISSGILELYVLGYTSIEENEEIQRMAAKYPGVVIEISEIGKALERYAQERSVAPNPTLKPFILSTIDYIDRLKAGEIIKVPPVLNSSSKRADYAEWIDREDMVLTGELEDIYAKIICANPEMMTAIVWIKYMAPDEVHDDEYEKFLILEGSCDIIIGDDVHSLKAGDFMEIPLYVHHIVKITSDIPCKAILQRVAA